jgi:hypothetical protein
VQVLELMAEEPEVPARLQVVARRHLAGRRPRAGEEVRVDVQDRRPRRCEAADRVERGG